RESGEAGNSSDATPTLQPDSYEAGVQLLESGAFDEARTVWGAAAEAGDTTAAFNLGVLLVQRGELDEAANWWRAAAEAGDTDAAAGLGMLLVQRGELDESEALWRAAAEAGNTDAATGLGRLLVQRGDLAEAETWWRTAAEAGDTEAATGLGVLLEKRGEHDEAETWWRTAAEAGEATAATGLGVLLVRRGDVAEAETWWRTAAEAGEATAASGLGLLLEQRGDAEGALGAWQQALQPDEARVALLNQRARLLEQSGRLEEAEQTLHRSLATVPDQPDAIQHWLHLRQKMCRWPVLAEIIPGLPRDALLASCGPLASLALSDQVAVQARAATNWIARKTAAAPARLSPPRGYDHKRIRLGYMSSDFCRHAMSYLIAELFERHDRDRFELFGYCISPDDGSEIRARVISAFDHFTVIRDLPDEAAARRIRADEIDILIDLNGLTAGARLSILRWRPAPIQATYLGFIGPVPLPELDYLFCDSFVVPPETAAAYSPRPLYIAANYQANDRKRMIGAKLSREQLGLPEHRFVFCCFSNHYKVTEDIFAAWMRILRQAPDSVLWLTDDNRWSRENLRNRAAELGVDPARLIFAGRADPSEYMARLAVPDLFLDTFPYNAGTIASDAIRMGLPLLTLSGEAFASRMAGRLLAAVGANGTIARDMAEYERIAVELATNGQAHAAARAAFNEGRWAETIGDIGRFTTELEATLIQVQQDLRAGA
ncbi:MAG TPA: tetratricopeptide repeat protein, partial [Acetobacteraceae bacterium]